MQKAAQINAITHGPIWKQLLLFFLPILFGSFFQQLYTTVDAVIVGRLAGKEALAAIDATSSLVRLFVNSFIGISTGAAILISQHCGAGRDDEASATAHTAVAFALLGGLLLTIVGVLFTPQGIRLMQVPGDLSAQAVAYLRAYSLGMIPSMVYNMGAGILRAMGDSKKPLYFLLAGSVVNILLDLLFVAVFRWGVAGAAIATVIAQAVSMALVLVSLARSRTVCRIRAKQIRLDKHVTRQIFAKGLPIGLQSAMYPVSNMIIHARINAFGTDTIAAWAICGKLDFPIWIIMDALAVAISTFAAQNYGAGRHDRVSQSVRACVLLGLTIILPLSAALYFGAEVLGRLFVGDAQVIAASAALLRFYAPFFFVYIGGEVLGGAVRGTGDTLRPMLITMLFTCALRVMWVLWLAPADAAVQMIVAAYPVTWAATSLAFVTYYLCTQRKSRAAVPTQSP